MSNFDIKNRGEKTFQNAFKKISVFWLINVTRHFWKLKIMVSEENLRSDGKKTSNFDVNNPGVNNF